MEMLKTKRARLRDELRRAHDAWMFTSGLPGRTVASGRPDNASAAGGAVEARRREYIAAKKRLVLAYAERPLAA